MGREEQRRAEIERLTDEGLIPHDLELEKHPELFMEARSWLMGKVAGAISVSASCVRADWSGC